MKKILLVAGTRPNFIKLAPLYHRLKSASSHEISVCHTGQHFDYNMSDVFWELLQIPKPDFMLECTGSSSSEIIGKTILGLNQVLEKNSFDLIIVFGDVNATVAGAIVGSHRRIRLMHVESGLRSFDRDMPEELNRIVTDHLSDFLMISEDSGIQNLKHEGISADKIFQVGNIMIESLIRTRPDWEKIDVKALVGDQATIVATFHRPENVDHPDNLRHILNLLTRFSKGYCTVFPVHPRTKKKLQEFNLWDELHALKSVIITEPLDYFRFLKIISLAKAVITDSGGVQEETSFLQIPCITLRKNTERPVTISKGTNLLCSVSQPDLYETILNHIQAVEKKSYEPIEFWDDQVSRRMVDLINRI